MLEFGNSIYYIDIEAFDRAITVTTILDGLPPIVDTETKTTINEGGQIVQVEKLEKTYGKIKEIDAVKYDLLKSFVEYLMDYDDITDDTLGLDRAFKKAPLGYKVIFNTLLNQGILKEIDAE